MARVTLPKALALKAGSQYLVNLEKAKASIVDEAIAVYMERWWVPFKTKSKAIHWLYSPKMSTLSYRWRIRDIEEQLAVAMCFLSAISVTIEDTVVCDTETESEIINIAHKEMFK